MKFKEELKLEPDVMFQPLVYIELAYKEGLLEEIAYAIKIWYEENRVIECRCKFEVYAELYIENTDEVRK